MTHYVVLCDWAVNFDNGYQRECHVTGVAHSLEEAKEILAKASFDEKIYARQQNWDMQEDSDMCFYAKEKSDYDVEHVYFYIEEVSAK